MQRVAYHPNTAKIKLLLWQNARDGKRPGTVLDIAKKLDTHSSTISRAINGKIKDGRWLEMIAKEMGVEVGEIASRRRRAA